MENRSLRLASLAAAVALAAALTAALAAAAPARPAAPCTKVVSAGGSVQALVDSLAPGETGCLSGAFDEDVTIGRGGRAGAPITVTSLPGERALLRGRLYIRNSANDVVVSGLRLDGRNRRNLPSPTIYGDRVAFLDNDVTNGHTTICFILGSGSGGVAVDNVIEGNRIHNCGELPATNHHHGIYIEASRGARIVNNVIYDNADRGIQLYPDAQDTLISGNLIDGNGQGILFAGDGGVASNGNRVVGNVISNSKLRYNVESWYPEGNPIGRDNLAERNCLWGGARGNVSSEWGFDARENVIANPLFVDRDAKDFRLRPDGACARVLSGANPDAVLVATVRSPDRADNRAPSASARKHKRPRGTLRSN